MMLHDQLSLVGYRRLDTAGAVSNGLLVRCVLYGCGTKEDEDSLVDTKPSLNPWDRLVGLVSGVERYRLAVVLELVGVLVVGVLVTILPQVTLVFAAGVADWMRDAALSYRSVVSLVGLIVVILSLWGILAVAGRNPMASLTKIARRTSR